MSQYLSLCVIHILTYHRVAGVAGAAGCSIPGAPCALSGDINQWNTVAGFKDSKRMWGRPELEPAYVHTGGLYHVKRLLDKLGTGQRVISVALGSSFVHNFAGCWQTSLQALCVHVGGWVRGQCVHVLMCVAVPVHAGTT